LSDNHPPPKQKKRRYFKLKKFKDGHVQCVQSKLYTVLCYGLLVEVANSKSLK
jgi:hypothetical protein